MHTKKYECIVFSEATGKFECIKLENLTLATAEFGA